MPEGFLPTPKVNQLVDATARHELLSFMDAYSRYNQIQICLEDEDKTTFIMDRGLYCYKVIPFGSKH